MEERESCTLYAGKFTEALFLRHTPPRVVPRGTSRKGAWDRAKNYRKRENLPESVTEGPKIQNLDLHYR